VHAPVLAAGPDTTLTTVWARRPAAAEELAHRHGAVAVAAVDELFERCEAVAFCVPPGVQAAIAAQAATAGKALLLEKPVAADLAGAERLAAAVADAGVPTMVLLSGRYSGPVRAFLAELDGFDAYSGHVDFISGGLLGPPFATPWRLESGPLLDLGPHVIDLLDACLGPVVTVRAAGRRERWVSLLLEHESGATSTAELCGHAATDRRGVRMYGADGERSLDLGSAVGPEAFATVRAELASMVRTGVAHELDVRRGVVLQRTIEAATAQLR
jgi:predicted dehydrogenase